MHLLCHTAGQKEGYCPRPAFSVHLPPHASIRPLIEEGSLKVLNLLGLLFSGLSATRFNASFITPALYYTCIKLPVAPIPPLLPFQRHHISYVCLTKVMSPGKSCIPPFYVNARLVY